jgi:hypothetical protein
MKTLIEKKREEEWRYIYRGKHDVSGIAERLSSYNEEQWWLDRTRQQTPPFVHRETTSLFISEIIGWEPGMPYNPTFRLEDDVLWKMVKPIIDHYEEMHDGKVGKAVFLRLPEDKIVYQHYDEGDYLGLVHRHHIAIKTNPEATFLIDQEKKHMEVGDCWEINNARFHGVINSGKTERIHLLFDIMPNKYIN